MTIDNFNNYLYACKLVIVKCEEEAFVPGTHPDANRSNRSLLLLSPSFINNLLHLSFESIFRSKEKEVVLRKSCDAFSCRPAASEQALTIVCKLFLYTPTQTSCWRDFGWKRLGRDSHADGLHVGASTCTLSFQCSNTNIRSGKSTHIVLCCRRK